MRTTLVFLTTITLTACGGGGGSAATALVAPPAPVTAPPPQTPTTPAAPPATPVQAPNDLDLELATVIERENLTGTPSQGRALPEITNEVADLGKHLFFSTNLGGQADSACVSCHHPVLAGADGLSLSVGVNAVDAFNVSDPALFGIGRHSETAGNIPIVPRNAPTVFNSGLWDEGLFWDSRVASQTGTEGANGRAGGIVTPDSNGNRDAALPINSSLPAAQARFPVTSAAEMRAGFLSGENNQNLRTSLAARFNDPSTGWPGMFTRAFGDSSTTFDRIAEAIGEFERSMNFTDSPWQQYVTGELNAISEQQKDGALLFFTPVSEGGAGCSRCHSGDTFTDSQHHAVGFPQITDDRGREAISSDNGDRYHFRTPTLLNVAETAPYGHAGLYQTLEEVIDHYDNPRREVENLFGEQGGVPFQANNPGFCQLPQMRQIIELTGSACSELFPDAYANSELALNRLQSNQNNPDLGPTPNLNNQESAALVAFLEALTDPCVTDRTCLAPWIIDADDLASFPDGSALIGHDENKVDL